MHRHLGHPTPLHPDERRQEAVHPVEQRQPAQRLGAKRLEGAAGIADRLAIEPVAYIVGDTALQPLPARVPPVHAVPDDRRSPAPLELGDEGGNVGRVVLQIRVERDDDAPEGRAEARGESGGLTRVGGERHDVDLGVVALQRLEHLERAVGRAVVHGHDLVAPSRHAAGQRSADLLDQDR